MTSPEGRRDRAYPLRLSLPRPAAGTLLGAVSGDGIADPRSLGLDFLLVAFCMAMGAGLLRTRSDAGPAAAGVLVAAVLEFLAPSGWTVVAAGLAGGAVAALRHREPA